MPDFEKTILILVEIQGYLGSWELKLKIMVTIVYFKIGKLVDVLLGMKIQHF